MCSSDLRSKLGGVDTSILHHAFISIFIALWDVVTHYITILILQGLHEEGESLHLARPAEGGDRL